MQQGHHSPYFIMLLVLSPVNPQVYDCQENAVFMIYKISDLLLFEKLS
jgi:hypothetical protein